LCDLETESIEKSPLSTKAKAAELLNMCLLRIDIIKQGINALRTGMLVAAAQPDKWNENETRDWMHLYELQATQLCIVDTLMNRCLEKAV